MSTRKPPAPQERDEKDSEAYRGYLLRRTGARARSNSRRPPRMPYGLRSTLCSRPVFPA
jgi:hypothetical protein